MPSSAIETMNAADVGRRDRVVAQRERDRPLDLDLAVRELRLGRDVDALGHAVEREVAVEGHVDDGAGQGLGGDVDRRR